MKKIKKTLLLLLSFALAGSIFSCEEKKKTENEESTEVPTKEVNPPEQIISNEEAKKLYTDYEKNVINVLEEDEEARKKEARFVSYELETIKNYIAYIEQEAQKANNTEIKSLRFYFGKYPKGEKENKNTVFMVPTTRFKGMKDDQGFYIHNDGEGNLTAVSIKKEGDKMGVITKKTKKEYASFSILNTNTMPPSDESLTMNRGHSGPPPTGDY